MSGDGDGGDKRRRMRAGAQPGRRNGDTEAVVATRRPGACAQPQSG
jgi:hypothetical protein